MKKLMPEGQVRRLLGELLSVDGWRTITIPPMRLRAGLHWITLQQRPDGRLEADVS